MFGLPYLLRGLGGVGSGVLALAAFAFCIWMAFDCWKRNGEVYWIYLILFSGGTFALIYFFTQYWDGSRFEHGIWRWFSDSAHARELERRAKQLGTAPCYEELGHAQYGLRRFAQAEMAYRHALTKAPESFEAQAGLGYVLMQLHRAEEAWPYLAKAYQLKPAYDDYNLLWMVARCQAQRGNHAEARKLYEFFIGKHGYSEARIEYARVLAQLDGVEAGRAELQELVAEIEFSPSYVRRREQMWVRAAKKLLREWSHVAA